MTMAKIPRKEKTIDITQSHWSIYIGIDSLDRNNTLLPTYLLANNFKSNILRIGV